MPGHKRLKVGDRIRLLAVPKADLEQRTRELREGIEAAGHTADTLERIIAQDPVVTVNFVDEYGLPWFEYELKLDSGELEYHSIAVMDDDSWEYDEESTT